MYYVLLSRLLKKISCLEFLCLNVTIWLSFRSISESIFEVNIQIVLFEDCVY